ncbi:IclR family transcriptional regulator [Neobacillus pocheonensis]|uniref:IclR family transcriptional regulator n=1 Tax=Bacillaceae TaxID=186817 RepID=UPI001C45560A|nr:IclR family transcriptional regulator [Bacillus sp. sid0103]MBV7508287.1 IclR family transcriptional regulator [Bacillus sp. sid0103]
MQESKVQSIDRAFMLLEHLVKFRSAGVYDLARETGLANSTVHRLLQAMQASGVVVKDPQTNRYQPGIRLFEWGQTAVIQLRVRELAKPFLQEFATENGETAAIGILDGSDVIYIDWIPSRHLVQSRVTIGERVPAYSSSLGKCLIAWLPSETRLQLFKAMPMFVTEHGSDDKIAEAETCLAEVRQRGFAIDKEQRQSGACTVAAPLKSNDGSVIAAIGLGAPSSRVTEERMDYFGKRLVELAITIESHLEEIR